MKKGITNREAKKYIDLRLEFETKNKTIFGVWEDFNHNTDFEEELYVVYSYGAHFPVWIYNPKTDQWYGNKDNYSQTTSRHQSMTRPNEAITEWYDTDQMSRIAMHGVIKTTIKRMEGVPMYA